MLAPNFTESRKCWHLAYSGEAGMLAPLFTESSKCWHLVGSSKPLSAGTSPAQVCEAEMLADTKGGPNQHARQEHDPTSCSPHNHPPFCCIFHSPASHSALPSAAIPTLLPHTGLSAAFCIRLPHTPPSPLQHSALSIRTTATHNCRDIYLYTSATKQWRISPQAPACTVTHAPQNGPGRTPPNTQQQ